MTKFRICTILILSAFGFAGSGCDSVPNLGTTSSPSVQETIWKPFDSFSFTTDQAIIRTMSLEPNATAPADYGFNEGNGSLRGQFRFDDARKTFLYERSLASGNSWNDFTIFPPDSNGMLGFFKLSEIKRISVLIKAQSNANASFSQCGLAFGFGTAAGHSIATGASTELRLAGRSWAGATNPQKNPRDYFRISYSAQTAVEKVVVDAPINSYNAGSEWANFTAAEWLESAGEVNLIANGAGLDLAGDYITYKMTLQFDKDNHSVVIGVSDLGSNVTMTGWGTSKSVTWDYSLPVGSVDGVTGTARSGLDLTNVNGPGAMSLDDFHEQTFKLGFIGNQMARVCEYSDLQVVFEP